MPTNATCTTCGAPLVNESIGCTSCLLKLALDGDSNSLPGLERCGDYELIEEIARGGMGVVFRARQRSVDRIVALKVIARDRAGSAELIERFRVEAEAAAKLDHPNIIPIYEVGEHEGQPYLTMKLIEGTTLDVWAREGRPGERSIAQVMAQCARAIAHAHQHAVLHRDLKPRNILVDEAGEPFVTDFGLAKLAEHETGLTRTTDVLGTPAYMSPEQAMGKTREITIASDTYSLGAILYELLTGQAPFRAATPLETLRQVLETEPAQPSTLNRSIDRDLETICLKCLEKDPRRRYATATALADDLERWLKNEPIEARPSGNVERLAKWAARNPTVAGLSAAALLLLITLAVGSTVAAVLFQRQRDRTKDVAERLRRNLYAADVGIAGQALVDGNFSRAQDLLDRHRPQSGEEDLRGFEWRYLRARCQTDERSILPLAPAPFGAVAFDHSSTLIVAEGDPNRIVVRRELAQPSASITITGGTASAVALAPDGGTLAVAGADYVIALWDTMTGASRGRLVGHTAPINALMFSSDGRRLLSHSLATDARLWNLADKSEIARVPLTVYRIPLALSADGNTVAFKDNNDRQIRLWHGDRTTESTIPFPTNAMLMLGALSPDGTLLAAGATDGAVHLWEMSSGRELALLPLRNTKAWRILFSPDGQTLAITGYDNAIHFWNVATRKNFAVLRGHSSQALNLAFTPDGRTLATAGADNSVRLWNVGARPDLDFRLPRPAPTDGIVFSPDSRRVAFLLTDGVINVWDVEQRAPVAELPGEWNNNESSTCGGFLAFTPDGQKLYAKFLNTITSWDIALRRKAGQLATPGPIYSWALSPGGDLLATGGEKNSIRLWTTDVWQERASLPGHRGVVRALAFAPDGSRLASAGDDGAVRLWDVKTSQELPFAQEQQEGISRMLFSPDGKLLVTGGADETVQLWEAATGRLLARWRPGSFISIQFTPDSRTLVFAGSVEALRLWNVATGQEVLQLPGHTFETSTVAASPDGRWLASTSVDRTVRFWRAPTLAEIEAARPPQR